MCGRFTLRTPARLLAEAFGVADVPEYPCRYNIAPTQDVLAVLSGDDTRRRMRTLRWGLVPAWADDPSIGSRMVNARAETVTTKPSFRHAFERNRCLVLADGFYEWQKQGRTKQPMLVSREDGQPFAFAGLWERWRKGPREITSCTILTTEADDFIRPIHDRMPLILRPEDYDRWLTSEPESAVGLLEPCSTEGLTTDPVGTLVNNPQNDVPECVVPVKPSSLF